MKLRFLFCVLMMTLLACSASDPVGEIPRPAPLSIVTKLDGSTASISSLSTNRPLVLVFWATWCPHSRPFVVKLNDLAKKHPAANFVAISVNENGDYDELVAFIKEKQLDSIDHSFSGNDYYDESYIRYGVSSIPYAFVIDTHQTIRAETRSISEIDDVLSEIK